MMLRSSRLKNFCDMFNRFATLPECFRHTDRQTDRCNQTDGRTDRQYRNNDRIRWRVGDCVYKSIVTTFCCFVMRLTLVWKTTFYTGLPILCNRLPYTVRYNTIR